MLGLVYCLKYTEKANPNHSLVTSKQFGLYSFGAPSEARTLDTLIKSQVLYQLS